jgi:hypothetical protein
MLPRPSSVTIPRRVSTGRKQANRLTGQNGRRRRFKCSLMAAAARLSDTFNLGSPLLEFVLLNLVSPIARLVRFRLLQSDPAISCA